MSEAARRQREDDVWSALQALRAVLLEQQDEILRRDVLKPSWHAGENDIVAETVPFLRQHRRVAIALDVDDSERLTAKTSSLPGLLDMVRGAAYRERHGLDAADEDLAMYFCGVMVEDEDQPPRL